MSMMSLLSIMSVTMLDHYHDQHRNVEPCSRRRSIVRGDCWWRGRRICQWTCVVSWKSRTKTSASSFSWRSLNGYGDGLSLNGGTSGRRSLLLCRRSSVVYLTFVVVINHVNITWSSFICFFVFHFEHSTWLCVTLYDRWPGTVGECLMWCLSIVQQEITCSFLEEWGVVWGGGRGGRVEFQGESFGRVFGFGLGVEP